MGISPRVMCVVCGGGCGYVLLPRDVKLIKETNKKQLIMSAHLCSCWLVFLFLVHLFALFCPFLLLFALVCSFLLFLLFLVDFSAHVCSFWLIFLFFLPLPVSVLPFEYFFFSCLLFLGSFFVYFCIYLPWCLLSFSYVCSYLLLFAQFGSL